MTVEKTEGNAQNSILPLEAATIEENSIEVPDVLKHILYKYQRVFDIPIGLPLARICDHRITLQPNSGPVKVRPYRYPHSQKTEIEKMVEQMLHKGLIEPSNNPFSSPVILVK